jgi:hypothetical protein
VKHHAIMRLTAVAPLVAWLLVGCSSASESSSTTERSTGGTVQSGGTSNPAGLPSQPGETGTGGTITGTGATIIGTGGTTTGSGGTDPGSGGADPGSGGADSGSGGTVITSGGTDPGSGGAHPGSGGTMIGSGGTDPGSGGTIATTGGSAMGGSAAGATGGGGAQTGGASSGGYPTTSEGFYKQLFMDVGVGLDNSDRLPAADQLGYSWEFISTEDDEALQHFYMTGNEDDANGVLLYPDREPRFMILYTGGGYGEHAGAVGDHGIRNVQDFYYNGGSYTGTCHGNYLAWNWGYNFWPGNMNVDSYEGRVDGIIPEDSPLLHYYDFGGDYLIEGLAHYMGGYATGTLPEGTEVLLIGKSASSPIDGDGHPTGWAYKAEDTSGRMVGIADHPEYAFQPGEIMDYLAAAFNYAHDGVASPDVKASLVNGQERVMDRSSGDNDPAYTRIGDKQYHHFTVSLPNGASEMTVTLDADDRYDMNLYIAKDTFALASRAEYADTSQGADKSQTVSSLEPGTWYIGVECAATVVAEKNSYGYDYSGSLEVLNGVEYSIRAAWTE